jgi:hypothetical protein
MDEIDYRGFIEAFFSIKTKKGAWVPFIFNDVQNMWYDDLVKTYGKALSGIRENDLKGRQFGISSAITGIFCVDFILSALNECALTDSEIYSYRDKDTEAHFGRVNGFLESYLVKQQGGDYSNPEHRLEAARRRPHFLKTDTTNLLIARNGVMIQTATAGAKVAGRGSTKQNIHWSEVAFYPNTPILDSETLVTGAEEQVPEGYGKIFRETTGHMAGDFFSREYQAGIGKDAKSEFHSRFLAWYLHKEYHREVPQGWVPPEYYSKILSDHNATVAQCYWHFVKTRELQNKKRLREYPTYDFEAFLMSGTSFFDEMALMYHTNRVRKPLKQAMYVTAL